MSTTPAPQSVVRRLREMTVVSVAGLGVLAGLVMASELHARASYTPALERLVQAGEGLDALHSGMLDQQTGLRGYLSTADRGFLAPYDAGGGEVLSGVVLLAGALRDAEGARLFAEVQRRAAEWQQEYGAPTAVLAGTDLADANAAARTSQGKVLFDRYRQAHDRLDAHLQEQLPQLQATRDRVRLSLLVAALALLGLVGAMGAHWVRGTRAVLDRPVTALAERARAAVDRRRPGEPVPVCAELVPLAEALDDLVDDLEATRVAEAALAERLVRAGQVTAVLLEHTRVLAATTDAPAVAATTGESAMELLGGDWVAVWLATADGALLSYTSGPRAAAVLVDERLGSGAPAARNGHAQRALHFGRVFVDDDGERTRVAAPLVAKGRALGVVEVAVDSGRPDATVLDALQVLLSQGATALTSARRLARTDELVHRDPLTGLANRRQLQRDLAALGAGPVPDVGLLVLDVDHFNGSTTCRVTRPGTTCSARSATCCSRWCARRTCPGRATPSTGTAARSSWCCSGRARPRR